MPLIRGMCITLKVLFTNVQRSLSCEVPHSEKMSVVIAVYTLKTCEDHDTRRLSVGYIVRVNGAHDMVTSAQNSNRILPCNYPYVLASRPLRRCMMTSLMTHDATDVEGASRRPVHGAHPREHSDDVTDDTRRDDSRRWRSLRRVHGTRPREYGDDVTDDTRRDGSRRWRSRRRVHGTGPREHGDERDDDDAQEDVEEHAVDGQCDDPPLQVHAVRRVLLQQTIHEGAQAASQLPHVDCEGLDLLARRVGRRHGQRLRDDRAVGAV